LPDTERHALIGRLASQTVGLLETEFPNGMRVTLTEPMAEPLRPRAVHPAYYGCYDWHSSVHSHWQLVRAIRTVPDGVFVGPAVEVLGRTLTEDNIEQELQWISARPSFEMPYGMAWLLLLCAELAAWDSPEARRWRTALSPLEAHAADRFVQLCQGAQQPVRGGLHNQTAFSLGLVWDAAGPLAAASLRAGVKEVARRLYRDDRDVDLRYEPSATDFLSPALAEAELLSRLLEPEAFGRWLDGFAPEGFGRLVPVQVVDPSDGQLAHWAGLNLSRSWMLRRIGEALPVDDVRRADLFRNAADHVVDGLSLAAHPDYMVSHWVPTFAVCTS